MLALVMLGVVAIMLNAHCERSAPPSDYEIIEKATDLYHRWERFPDAYQEVQQASIEHNQFILRDTNGEITWMSHRPAHCPQYVDSPTWNDNVHWISGLTYHPNGYYNHHQRDTTNTEKDAVIRQIHSDIDRFIKLSRDAGCRSEY